MRITIIKPDGVVGINGHFLPIDLSALPDNLRVVQWDGSQGHVEWTDRDNTQISSIAAYQSVVDAWQNQKDYLDARAADPFYGMGEDEKRTKFFAKLKAAIVDLRKEKNDADFLYLGCLYVSDEPNILGVKSQIEGYLDSDPIPTFTGTPIASSWATSSGAFTPFTCGEFRAFAAFYFRHREKNFTNYTLLTIALTELFMQGATSTELSAFDISGGWD